ncbi:AI-2E family transporter [Legionella jamestowniensis]|uniref:Transporter, permease n=1 Tax=Legionella jamestowniensis TaxID=455 RepID=A0A0W0UP69_9GAMM|nr:AI-2E family transporter [Legionella jamestowniensis]KTD09430.1 transporter, permease [Legionella jamestowniensis]SFL89196.1 Predicted PurR-regulated permease PerM [Legionella jamestowniensis DSM 19215]
MNKSSAQTTVNWEIKIVTFLAIIFVLYIAQTILLPLLLAFFLYLLLNPLMQVLLQLRIPKILASAIITASLLALISFGISSLTEPAAHWIDQAPQKMQVLEQKFSSIKKPIAKLSDALKRAQTITETKPSPKVEIKTGITDIGYSIFDLTTNVILLIFLVLAYLFFFLIYTDTIFKNLQRIITHRQTKIANDFLLTIEKDVSTYLITFTIICICLGLVITTVLWLLSIPNAMLWGVMAACLNFIPYIGAAIGIFVIFFVSLLTFDSYFYILLPPLLYFLISNLEGQIITPILLGHRLNLNPLIVFFSIIFWVWLWGIGGGLLSIPLLTVAKIMMAHIPSLAKYSLLLEK